MLLLLLFLLVCVDGIQICKENYCPPVNQKSALILEEENAPIMLGRDNSSGCYCREFPQQYVKCFGRENCRKFPKYFNITTPKFILVSSTISELKRNDLEKLHHLKALLIEENFNFHRIEPGAFLKMSNLINMSISHNSNLKYLEPNVFEGLVNLKVLFLIKNSFVTIYQITAALPPKYLPALNVLNLSENTFSEIKEDAFQAMENSTLEELQLVLCQIEYLHPQVFAPLKNLEILKIGINSFNESVITDVLRSCTELNIPLKVLSLASLSFRKKPPLELMEVISNSSITSLSLAKNQFEVISFESFPYMPNLRVLDLQEVLALNITNRAFTTMPNLKTLLLNNNKLSAIPDGVLLPNLTYLDLQQNTGNLFFPSSFSLYKSKFAKMKNLLYLDLSYNHVKAIHKSSFTGLNNLQYLSLKSAFLYHIDDESFTHLKNLLVLDLDNNFFARNQQRGMEKNLFKGLEKLRVLSLANNDLAFISSFFNVFEHLVSLEHLDIRQNKISTLYSTDFMSLKSLRSIDLSQNFVISWTDRIFGNNSELRLVNISKNKINYFTKEMLDDFQNITSLGLEDNPFTCDCSTYEYFNSWNSKNPGNIILENISRDVVCLFSYVNNNNNYNFSFVDYIKSVQNGTIFCDSLDDNTIRIFIMLPLLLILIFFVVLGFFLYYYRWYVRYWIFLARLYLSRKGKIRSKRNKTCYTNYVYDAFVSYSNEDRNFVIRLVTMLENYEPFLKLCVYERDFQIGTIISESVLESVAKSRKTLLIVSDSYAKSQWCRWESQIAEHHRLFFENENGEYVDDSLVLIKLGPVSENHLTPTLKYLLKTRIYLQWDADDKKQKTFWVKLRNALTPPNYIEQIAEENNTHM